MPNLKSVCCFGPNKNTILVICASETNATFYEGTFDTKNGGIINKAIENKIQLIVGK